MKSWTLIVSLMICGVTLFGQPAGETKGFLTFNEYLENTPSLSFTCIIRKRTTGDVFMMGGIQNYRLKKVKPYMDSLAYTIWGVTCGDSVFINSYQYSGIEGFNKILGTGYYTYFIGEPARTKEYQVKLGMISPTDKAVPAAGNALYVLFQSGEIKVITPKSLMELLKDNENLYREYDASNLEYMIGAEMKDVPLFLDYLRRYNESKK